MTARTQVLEKANAQSSVSSSQNSNTHGTSPIQLRHSAPRGTRSASYHSSQASDGPSLTGKIYNIRATWTGKLLVITGLHPEHFPVGPPSTHVKLNSNGLTRNTTRGTMPKVEALSPSKGLRPSLKRRRSGTNGSVNGTYGESNAHFDGSRKASQANTAEEDADEYNPESREHDAEYGEGDDGQDEAHADEADRAQMLEKPKRRRRGQRLLEQAMVASRAPSPTIELVSEKIDKVDAIDLPAAFLSRSLTPDPNEFEDPDDVATKLYKRIYEPLTKAEAFMTALTKINPAQRRTDNLYEIAANTAAALRLWQDEYLVIDRLTAPHAPIPRKPATGNRQLIDPYLFEDTKEADIYDYILDTKKIGHQNPITQKVVRDASGRELRMRGPKTRITADNQLLNAANISEDDVGRRHRSRKPVSKYDGINPEEQQQRRKRGIGQVSDSIEGDGVAKRGRWSNGRGGRGRGRGGRGGASRLLGKRIREMREESDGTAMSYAEDDSGSEVGLAEPDSRDVSLAPSQDDQDDSHMNGDDLYGPDGEKKKGRPKGSKNLHFRSDKGIPKGPRQPKPSALDTNGDATSSLAASDQPAEAEQAPPAVNAKPLRPGQKPPKSEKRSESMTIWWAKRKAAAAEARRKEAEAAGLPPPVEKPRSRAPKAAVEKAPAVSKPATTSAPHQPSAASPHNHQPPLPATPYAPQQRYSNGPSPSNPHMQLGPPPPPQSQPMSQHPAYSQAPAYPPPPSTSHYHSGPAHPSGILSDPRRGVAGSPPVAHDRLPSIHDFQAHRGSIFRDPAPRDPMPRDPRDPYGASRDMYDPARQYDRRDVPPLQQHGYPPHPNHPNHPAHGQYPQQMHGLPPPPPPFLGYPPPPPSLQQDPRYRGLGQAQGRDGRRY